MKLRFIFAVLVMLVSTHARADDADSCVKASGDIAIAACTRAIESGRWQGANLASAYNNRGSMKQANGDLAETNGVSTYAGDVAPLPGSGDRAPPRFEQNCYCPQVYDPVTCRGGAVYSNACVARCAEATDCRPGAARAPHNNDVGPQK